VESGNQTDEWGDKLAFTEKRPHGASEECDLAVSADGRIVAWGDGQAVRLWDTVARKDLIAPIGHRAAVTGLGISKDGKTLVSHGEDGALRRWDLVSDKQLQNLPMPAGTTIAAIAPNCDIAALANADGTIRIIDMTTGKERRQHKGHVRPNPDRLNETVDLRFSPDGNILATQGSFDCTIRLHDPVRGAELREIKFGDTASPDRFREFVVRGGMGLAFSADGQTVGACETRTPGRGPYAEEGWYTAKIRQWDVVTGKELRSIALDGRCLITQIVYSPDGRLLAALQSDQTVRLYETATASLRAVLGKPRPSQLSTAWNYQPRYEPAPSRSLTFSRDGRILLSPAPMDTLRVWDVHAAKEIGACKGHEGAILAALFTSDGKRIVTASNDTTMLVWDATRWKHAAIAVADIAPRELESCWSDLAGEDAAKAFASMQKLRSAPKQSVTFLSERLKPVAGPDARRIDRLIADLDSSDFRARTQAGKELEGMGEPALAALKKAHASDLSPEVRRRIASLLEKLTPIALGADDVRLVRGVEILERMGTPEARRVLAGLAKGAPGVLATQQAQMALDRLENR
jgi:WD40 repeat protein